MNAQKQKMRHQHRIDDDASRSSPLDKLSRGTTMIDLTTAAANNEWLFVATATVHLPVVTICRHWEDHHRLETICREIR